VPLKKALAESNNTLMGRIRLSEGRELRIELAKYLGGQYAALRVWEPQNGRLAPSQKGLTVAAAFLPQLIQALSKTERSALADVPVVDKEQTAFQFTHDFYRAARDK